MKPVLARWTMRRAFGALAMVVVLASSPASPPAEACGWDWETYHAEANSLPCVYDAILGFWPKHTDDYHRARIAAADEALRWSPGWTDGLDAKGISLLELGRMAEAEAVMQRRLALTPDAYPAHANLGTLFTFTGDYAKALEHIDAAMGIEPKAHFGREKYELRSRMRAAMEPVMTASVRCREDPTFKATQARLFGGSG